MRFGVRARPMLIGAPSHAVFCHGERAAAGRRVGWAAWSMESRRGRVIARCRIGIITISVIAATGCDVNRALEQLSEARRLSSDLLVQFTK
jgi:hypothetical protein